MTDLSSLLDSGQKPEILLVFAGPGVVEAQCRRLEVRSKDGGKVLFAADEEEVVMTSEKFTITGQKNSKWTNATPTIECILIILH